MPKITKSDISVTRYATDGFRLSAMVNGHLFHRRYIGYTLKEAKAMFLKEANNA